MRVLFLFVSISVAGLIEELISLRETAHQLAREKAEAASFALVPPYPTLTWGIGALEQCLRNAAANGEKCYEFDLFTNTTTSQSWEKHYGKHELAPLRKKTAFDSFVKTWYRAHHSLYLHPANGSSVLKICWVKDDSSNIPCCDKDCVMCEYKHREPVWMAGTYAIAIGPSSTKKPLVAHVQPSA